MMFTSPVPIGTYNSPRTVSYTHLDVYKRQELVKMDILKGVESGGSFAGGRMCSVNTNGATSGQGFVRFLELENSRNRNADGVPVRSLRKVALTRSNTSTKLHSSRKKTV